MNLEEAIQILKEMREEDATSEDIAMKNALNRIGVQFSTWVTK